MSPRIHTAHLRPGADPVETVLIDDRWRWGAAGFPLIWALWNRHWLAAAAILAAMLAIGAVAALGGAASAFALDLGLRLAVGFEGGALARLDRRLRGWRTLGAVVAGSGHEAEWVWFGLPDEAASATPARPQDPRPLWRRLWPRSAGPSARDGLAAERPA